MSTTTDFVSELVRAANTLPLITPFERQRLVKRAIETVKAQRQLLALHGTVVAIAPAFMGDMEKLAILAGEDKSAEIMVGAGLMLLAEEIRRLRMLLEADKLY